MIDRLRDIRTSFLERSYVPYSDRPGAAVVLLSDGTWVPGVRVENASFSLTLEASVNAVTTAVAAGRTDVLAVLSGDRESSLIPYLEGVVGGTWRAGADGTVVRTDRGALPVPGAQFDAVVGLDPVEAMVATRRLAPRAIVTQSDFRVACMLDLAGGGGLPGVNVEHPHWGSILCAERNALGTWVTAGRPALRALYLTCARDAAGTPCGACRQWLVELVPDVPVRMDRGERRLESAYPPDLLPGAFTGRSIRTGGGR